MAFFKKIDAHSKRYQVFAEILRTHEEIISSMKLGESIGRDAIAKILSEFNTIYNIIKLLEKEKVPDTNTELIDRIGVAFAFMYYGARDKTINKIAGQYKSVTPKPILDKIDAAKKSNLEKEINREYNSRISAHQGTPSINEYITKINLSDIQKYHRILITKSLNEFKEISKNSFNKNEVVQLIQKYTHPKELAKLHKFDGHQRRLSHYFRNLRSAFDYIKYEEFSRSEKEILTKILISKLSNHEQALIALYVLTNEGKEWVSSELVDELMPIRNIPEQFFEFDDNFKLSNMFPNVDFDWTSPKIKKNTLLELAENFLDRIR